MLRRYRQATLFDLATTQTATASSSPKTCLAACSAKALRLRWDQLLTALGTTEVALTAPMREAGAMLQVVTVVVRVELGCDPHPLPLAIETCPAAAWLLRCTVQAAQAASGHHSPQVAQAQGSELPVLAAEDACE